MLSRMSDSEQSPVSRSKRGSKPAETPAPTAKAVIESAPGQAVTGATDPVYPSKLIYDPHNLKSLTVHHLQRRLAEVGYAEAAAGIDGQYDTLTERAFLAWQSDNDFEGTPDVDQLSALFDGDPNVSVENG